ncbi:hypothetical protein D7X32_31050 [Corallococcus carmarthensis]|uniref:Uncharacterized protein n=1 Tax=Corallococcus carmarthensis TaxID=2316728 RepID=A0A3A8JQ78_9BACT|nr:hypothetical protein D7X32_31050 [Corallococcus carmarthensis]
MPQLRLPPHPSEMTPQVFPAAAQVVGWQVHTLLLHVCPAPQVPQLRLPPHPSEMTPQVFPWAAQVVGVHAQNRAQTSPSSMFPSQSSSSPLQDSVGATHAPQKLLLVPTTQACTEPAHVPAEVRHSCVSVPMPWPGRLSMSPSQSSSHLLHFSEVRTAGRQGPCAPLGRQAAVAFSQAYSGGAQLLRVPEGMTH